MLVAAVAVGALRRAVLGAAFLEGEGLGLALVGRREEVRERKSWVWIWIWKGGKSIWRDKLMGIGLGMEMKWK